MNKAQTVVYEYEGRAELYVVVDGLEMFAGYLSGPRRGGGWGLNVSWNGGNGRGRAIQVAS